MKKYFPNLIYVTLIIFFNNMNEENKKFPEENKNFPVSINYEIFKRK
jgi:hypothetical protein